MEIAAAQGENPNPYDGGLGISSTRTSEIRRSLSTLMDPAQRIITHNAHRLLASIFRRLPTPADSNLQPSETETEIRDTETLEQILKQMTFTRSEVDRLTTLLRSRIVDSSTQNHEQSNKSLHECITSPAELAEAYMSGKTLEVSCCMSKLRYHVATEDPTKSMARTPSSRSQSTMKISSLLPASQSKWEESLPSGSRKSGQKVLKRMRSISDNDIDSVVHVKRIHGPCGSSGVGFGSDFGHTSIRSNEDKPKKPKPKPGSSLKRVPSKSSKIASKILQTLDKMVSTSKEKLPK